MSSTRPGRGDEHGHPVEPLQGRERVHDRPVGPGFRALNTRDAGTLHLQAVVAPAAATSIRSPRRERSAIRGSRARRFPRPHRIHPAMLAARAGQGRKGWTVAHRWLAHGARYSGRRAPWLRGRGSAARAPGGEPCARGWGLVRKALSFACKAKSLAHEVPELCVQAKSLAQEVPGLARKAWSFADKAKSLAAGALRLAREAVGPGEAGSTACTTRRRRAWP